MAQPARSIWSPGMRFSRYEIVHRLARGGMADVWLARVSAVEGFRKDVVIKTMRPELARSEHLVRMFVNEATIAARMNHPSVVQVFDFGLLDGNHFIAMEHVAGRSLRRLGRTLRGRQHLLPRRLVLRLVADSARALAYAHALTAPAGDERGGGGPLGLVHGDVSPENIMVSLAGAAKLIDFGTASTRQQRPPPNEPRLGGHRGGTIMGKLRYIGPERLRGHLPDARTDVYALGVVLCEYLTGRHPYREEELRRSLAEGKMPNAAALVPDVPRRLAAIVRKAMAPDPDKRYASADQLADAIMPLLDADLGREPACCEEHELREALQIEDRADDLDGPGPDHDPDPESDDGRAGGDPPQARHWPLRVLTPLPAPSPEWPPASSPPSGHEGERAEDDDGPTLRYAAVSPAREGEGEGERGVSMADTTADPFAAAPLRPATPAEGRLAWLPVRVDPARASAADASFERGLELLGAGRPEDALVCWERAASLIPDRRWYRTNLERLRRQIDTAAAAEPGTWPTQESVEDRR
jgi:eukaryotic-like serine/threonine-protein kinase